MAHGVIDWSAPWLAPYQATTLDFTGSAVAQALNSVAGSPVRFVSQSQLPDSQAYEQFIFDTGTVPTRDNLHDFFLVCGKVNQHKPLKKSCRLSRVGTVCVSNINCS